MNGNAGCGSCPPSEGQVNIVQGQDKTFYVDLFYADTGEPFDLTAATEIAAYFPAADGTAVIKKLSTSGVAVIGAAGAGKISIILTAADTLLMQVNPSGPQFQDLQVKTTIAAKVTTFIIQAVLNIVAQPYADPV